MFCIKSFMSQVLLWRRPIAGSTALIWKVKVILLFFTPENHIQFLWRVLIWPQYHVPRVTQIGGFYDIVSDGIELGEDRRARAHIGVCLHALHQNALQVRVGVRVKSFLYVLHKLFGEKPRINAMLFPSANTVSYKHEILLRNPSVFTAFVTLLKMWYVAGAISEILLALKSKSRARKK